MTRTRKLEAWLSQSLHLVFLIKNGATMIEKKNEAKFFEKIERWSESNSKVFFSQLTSHNLPLTFSLSLYPLLCVSLQCSSMPHVEHRIDSTELNSHIISICLLYLFLALSLFGRQTLTREFNIKFISWNLNNCVYMFSFVENYFQFSKLSHWMCRMCDTMQTTTEHLDDDDDDGLINKLGVCDWNIYINSEKLQYMTILLFSRLFEVVYMTWVLWINKKREANKESGGWCGIEFKNLMMKMWVKKKWIIREVNSSDARVYIVSIKIRMDFVIS